jgi:hypothetical protein
MIAFTKHALDHMLSSVLDAGITEKIIRLGSRSADERISQFSIETLEMVNEESRLNRTFAGKHRELKNIQEAIRELMENVLKHDLDSNEVMEYLSTFHPEHHAYLSRPLRWIRIIKMLFVDNDDGKGEWQQQGRRGKTFAKDMSFYAFWRDGSDLAFIGALSDGSYTPWRPATPPQEIIGKRFGVLKQDDLPNSDDECATGEEDEDDSLSEDVPVEDAWTTVNVKPPPSEPTHAEEAPVPPTQTTTPFVEPEYRHDAGISQADFKDLDGFLANIGCSQLPVIPTSNRPLEELLEEIGNVWTMSILERRVLHNFWVSQTRIELAEGQKGEFERLREFHDDILRECNEGKEEVCGYFTVVVNRFEWLSRFVETCFRTSISLVVPRLVCACCIQQSVSTYNLVLARCGKVNHSSKGNHFTNAVSASSELLQGLRPRVLLVEEAGQVLEAHVLGSLMDSIEHLILIGDPLQLRPTLNNFCKPSG